MIVFKVFFPKLLENLTCRTIVTFSILSLTLVPTAFSQDADGAGTGNTAIDELPLFDSEEPLHLTLTADFKTLVKEKEGEDPEEYPAVLTLVDSAGGDKTFDIKIKARGFSRRTFDFCSFPPLLFNFKKKETRGTVFDGQNKLKLVTFCKDQNTYEEYVYKEYLVYKMYNILTDTSLRVRRVQLTYVNSENEKLLYERFGFLIEDIDHLAKRLDGKEIEMALPHHDLCDRTTLDRFIIFQYMIGNTDWWIPNLHNVKLISINNSPPIPVPYDFDYCGIVDATYAQTDEKLPIKSVKERYFRGFCRRPGTYEKILQGFRDHREEIYALIRDFPPLSDITERVVTKYIDQFYEIIDDPKQIIKRLYDTCEIQHPHLHEL